MCEKVNTVYVYYILTVKIITIRSQNHCYDDSDV